MKIEDIKKLTHEETSKMSRKELFELVKESNSLMKSRLTRLTNFAKSQNIGKPIVLREWGLLDSDTESKMRKYGIIDDEYRRKYKITKEDGKITGKKKMYNRNKISISYQTLHLEPKEDDKVDALRYKFKKIQNFLNDKTSTVSGWKNTMENFYERLLGVKNAKGREHLGKVNYNQFWKIYNKVQELQTYSDLDSNQVQKLIYSLRIDKHMSMREIEDFLVSNSRIEIDEYLEEEEIFYGGNND